jgi:pimeloyl-ACP methyl ester carboxylesterase
VRGAFGQKPNRAAVRETRDLFLGTPAAVRIAHVEAILAMDILGGCRTIAVPTTVVIGTRDTVTPPGLGRRIAATIPGARLVEVPGAGHMLPYEATDLLVDVIGGSP